MKSYFVYIIKCSDGSYYTGVTNDIEKRINEHLHGLDKNCYTFSRKPLQLKFAEELSGINNAIGGEKQIKGWSRKKKEALIRRDYDELIKYSKRHGSTSSP